MWQKVHGVTLTQKDRDVILDGEWLNDNIINAAQLLMKHDQDLLPVGSLQNPLLGQTLAFDVISDESVQILHSGGNHWITISTVGTKHPTVKIFDSLYNELPWETKEQIAALLQTKETAITLEFATVQVKTIILLIVSTIVDARVSISNRNREMALTAGCLPLLLQWQSAMGKTQRN